MKKFEEFDINNKVFVRLNRDAIDAFDTSVHNIDTSRYYSKKAIEFVKQIKRKASNCWVEMSMRDMMYTFWETQWNGNIYPPIGVRIAIPNKSLTDSADEVEGMKIFNTNEYVKFKLTEAGRDLLKGLPAEYAKKYEGNNVVIEAFIALIPKPDDEGFIEMQMWQAMNMFGRCMMNKDSELPFDTTVLISDDAFDNLDSKERIILKNTCPSVEQMGEVKDAVLGAINDVYFEMHHIVR